MHSSAEPFFSRIIALNLFAWKRIRSCFTPSARLDIANKIIEALFLFIYILLILDTCSFFWTMRLVPECPNRAICLEFLQPLLQASLLAIVSLFTAQQNYNEMI